MLETYYCLTIRANNYLWLFADKVLEITQEAIEEIDGGFIVRQTTDTSKLEEKLQEYAKELQEIMGEEVCISFTKEILKNEDWIANYRDSIQPILCGKYYIRPSWCEEKSQKINIIIDPALAFGSGHHESTFGCIEVLDSLNLKDKKVLDVGCGSGILSILAKKSGAKVWACDTDEVAIISTKENAQKNSLVLDSVWEGSLWDIEDKKENFDIVIANILADIIVALPLDRFLKQDGILILSGILDKYLQKVLDKFKNLEVISQKVNKEWATLMLRKI